MTTLSFAPLRQSDLPGAARLQLAMAPFYLLAGLVLGLGMAASGDFTLRAVHSHLLLLGWVTLFLTGLGYAVLPQAAASALARWHVALHNLGLPLMAAALTAYHLGVAAAEPVIALGSVLSLAGLMLFALAFWRALIARA